MERILDPPEREFYDLAQFLFAFDPFGNLFISLLLPPIVSRQ
jgi:hypothetical protein